MTALDPYPIELLEELPTTAPDPLVNAITRLAQAIEALAGRPTAVAQQQAPTLAPLPPVVATVDASFDGCPIHHTPWKVVPAGVSKKTGNAYSAFKACTVAGCDQRPRL